MQLHFIYLVLLKSKISYLLIFQQNFMICSQCDYRCGCNRQSARFCLYGLHVRFDCFLSLGSKSCLQIWDWIQSYRNALHRAYVPNYDILQGVSICVTGCTLWCSGRRLTTCPQYVGPFLDNLFWKKLVGPWVRVTTQVFQLVYLYFHLASTLIKLTLVLCTFNSHRHNIYFLFYTKTHFNSILLDSYTYICAAHSIRRKNTDANHLVFWLNSDERWLIHMTQRLWQGP